MYSADIVAMHTWAQLNPTEILVSLSLFYSEILVSLSLFYSEILVSFLETNLKF